MWKQYVKMAIQMLKESPLVSTISILGTALSVAMIMVVVLVYQIQLLGYVPENNRKRMMYVYDTEVARKNAGSNSGSMGHEILKECFYALKIPVAVTGMATDSRPISLPDKRLYKEYAIKYTDTGFWKVFDFSFVQGTSFSDADFRSGLRVAVVTDKTARELFGTTDVVGRTIMLDFMEFTIRGVVPEVTKQANNAYAEVWIPYTTNEALLTSRYGLSGSFTVCLLAKKDKDFPAIKNELERLRSQFNAGLDNMEVIFPHAPLTRMEVAMGSRGFKYITPREFWSRTGAILLFLLLVPALNLTGVTQSSVQRRRAELGVRKSFGATSAVLWRQILSENLVTSMIGGVIGFGLSFVLLYLCRNFLLSNQTLLNADMLLKPVTFMIALGFVLLLNLFSAAIPAIRITRLPIVDSLRDSE